MEDPSFTIIGRRGGTGSLIVRVQYNTNTTILKNRPTLLNFLFFQSAILILNWLASSLPTSTVQQHKQQQYQSIFVATLLRLSSYLDYFDRIDI